MRKGNVASSLIGIITLILVFWIFFLPPAERDRLLSDNSTSTRPTTPTQPTLLLSVPAGHLSAAGPTAVDHPLPSMLLASSTSAQILAQIPMFTIRNAWFDKNNRQVPLSIPTLATANNILLSYKAPVYKGTLSIMLNGATIHEEQLLTQTPSPLPLPKGLLQEQNTLDFSVSGVGLAFWRTNEYRIEGSVIADVTDTNRQQASTSISLEPDEYSNIDKSFLSFVASCDQKTTGQLSILLNNKQIHEGTPDCESTNRIDITPADLLTGRNNIKLSISSGNLRVEQLKVHNEFKKVRSFLTFFDVPRILFEEAQSRISRIILTITFVDNGTPKSAVINLNGHMDAIDQQQPTFTRDLSAIITPGNNYIEIVPRTDLDIVKVEIRVE